LGDSTEAQRAKASTCERCGALNGAGFGRCIRCGHALSPLARSADRLRERLEPHDYVATKILVGATILVFALQLWAGLRRGETALGLLLSRPASASQFTRDLLLFGALDPRPAVLLVEPWRLLSAVFVHIGGLHLALNMLALTNLARVAEPAVGSARFTVVYVVTGLLGFAASAAYGLLVDPSALAVTAGASGAIFGVMGMLLGFLYRLRSPLWKQFAIQAVLMSLLLGFAINQSGSGILVNNTAHVGGLLGGIVFGVVFAASTQNPARRRRSDLGINVAALLSLVACLASLVLAQVSHRFRERGRGTSSASNVGTVTITVDSDHGQ
jgi:membrane associated rhomboid family serine protease